MKYPAKKDPWAVGLFALAVAVLIGMGIFGGVVGVIGSVAMVLLLCSICFGTSYEISSSYVLLRWGPLPFRLIRIDDIVEAVPASSISATGRFALSTAAIRITGSSKFCGFLPPTVAISPRDRTGFLKALAAASTNLEQSDDGGVRRRSETAG